MPKKKMIAMLLAGGQGSRLGVLTKSMAKPAVPFGGKSRIIDFPLSNCVNSDIDTVGVLTQYEPLELNAYLGSGQPWDLDRMNGGVFVLPPYVSGSEGQWYSGTANAVCQNIPFIDQYDPEYVLILSGDHSYMMDYAAMLKCHLERGAEANALTEETMEVVNKLAELSRSLVEMLEQVKGSKDVENVRKGISFIKSKGESTIQQTTRRLRIEKLEADRKAKAEASAAAEKERQERLAAERKALVEEEVNAM